MADASMEDSEVLADLDSVAGLAALEDSGALADLDFAEASAALVGDSADSEDLEDSVGASVADFEEDFDAE
jgi:hypothetical protein